MKESSHGNVKSIKITLCNTHISLVKCQMINVKAILGPAKEVE